jgi:GNAT superfamily N-acetyltransferase
MHPQGLAVALLADHGHAVPKIADWAREAWPAHCGVDPAATTAYFHTLCRTAGLPLGFVAIDRNRRVAGVAALVAGASPEGKDVVLLSSLLVSPEARRRGIGRALVCAARDWSRERLHLFTEDAAPFFGRLGWAFVAHAVTAGARPRAVAFMRDEIDLQLRHGCV